LLFGNCRKSAGAENEGEENMGVGSGVENAGTITHGKLSEKIPLV